MRSARAARRLPLLLALALALAGCAAVGPDYKAEQPAEPADWTSWHGGQNTLLDAAIDAPPRHAAEAIPGATVFADPLLRSLID